jgi:DNA-binding PadR family transcriptional regulator
MAAVRTCGDEAYGAKVAERLLVVYGSDYNRIRSVTAQIYMTLKRLEEKGLLSSGWTAPTPTQGGRSKRAFSLTVEGRKALDRSLAFRRALAAIAEE